VDPSFTRPAHVKLLGEHLVRVANGEILRLIIQMPPRHSKSLTVTVRFPGWWLGKNPDKRVVLAAHTASLAQTFSRQVRNEFESFAPEVWGLRIADDSASVERWSVKGRQGGMVAVGVGGPLTGQGADLLLVDDAVKDFEEAQSRTAKESVWDWYRSVARTRLHPGGAIIVIMTRWSEDDLTGRLISEAKAGGEQWTVLSLPAIAEEGDPLGRDVGEALWPQRFSHEELMAIKAAVGSHVWNSLYQQHPTRQEGAVFQRSWFRYFRDEGELYLLLRPEGEKRVRKADCWVFQTVDPAATARETSDFFACGTWAVTPDSELLLIDMFHERLETPKHRALMSTLYSRFKPLLQGVENATFGLSLIQVMRAAPGGIGIFSVSIVINA